ncbi:uncharacterized protein F4807DRAFT_431752 [Annulohypoxylon truncatum]|uniref:uncharacterized protein n=1 Tax=Annulohypoxylon truncatum TaxID=327061 RepID=UPI00200892F2|nr:uncharacterized protein F4807DRAFT_431752 [Annulohypoxylon truncatum]KAI1208143.1 hypothetical protein F4807DRAFT_431752 [Annulohypoxylon truncatum]
MAGSMVYTDSDQVITVFDGALSTRVISHPLRAFALEATFHLDHPMFPTLISRKPPMHFHQHQVEYIQVLEGRLGFEHAGKSWFMVPSEGEFGVRPGVNHRSYPVPAEDPSTSKTLKFLISGEKTSEVFSLDLLFFENWYLYQQKLILNGQNPNIIQVLSTFDAGGSYLSFPDWMPFGRTISVTLGIVVGRWLGGLLGYPPFYPAWSSDWELACRKMKASIFQRRWADTKKL